MSETTTLSHPPQGLSRLLFRLPIWFYRLGIGWLLGKRFLLLNHTGRKSGLPRQTVLEVAGHDKENDSYLIASGWGKQSDWYQNLRKTPETSIQVGRRKLDVMAEILPPEESGQAMVDYFRRYPTAAKNITRFIGVEVDGSEAGYRRLGEEVIPFVRLRPK